MKKRIHEEDGVMTDFIIKCSQCGSDLRVPYSHLGLRRREASTWYLDVDPCEECISKAAQELAEEL